MPIPEHLQEGPITVSFAPCADEDGDQWVTRLSNEAGDDVPLCTYPTERKAVDHAEEIWAVLAGLMRDDGADQAVRFLEEVDCTDECAMSGPQRRR